MNIDLSSRVRRARNLVSSGVIVVALLSLAACGESDSVELAFSSTRVGGFGQCAVDVALHNNSSRRLNALQVQFGYELDGRQYGANVEFANVGPGATDATASYSGNAPRQPDCARIKPTIVAVGRCDLEGQREEACKKAVSLKR